MGRSQALQDFLDAACVAFGSRASDIRSRASIARIFALLDTPAEPSVQTAGRVPVCNRFLDDVLAVDTGDASLTSMLRGFRALEPSLQWTTKSVYDDMSASENFPTSHANAMIAGPNGLEERSDLWLGVTLMAPHVRYPDHDHSPEETYLVMSDSEFKQADDAWFAPGVGGSFYNPPGIRHAMRSGDKPLFAFWALLAGQSRH